MLSFIIALALLFLALLGIALRKTYYLLPVKELKRLARQGDPMAGVLYKAVSYGASLTLLLWIVIAVCFAASFVLLARIAPPILAFITEVIVIVFGFAYMPTTHITRWGTQLVVWVSPGIEWVLNYIHPLLDKAVAFARKHRPVTVHTGLYEREDLLELLEKQKGQPDSRFSSEELDLVANALTFGERMVGDCMVPRRVVRMASTEEAVSPIVIRELHDTGHSRFPVYQDSEENIVGTLYLRDLVNLKHTGKIGDVMEKAVYYVHEEYPLEQVLHAFLTTKHHLFIVVNSFEEFVGIITIEDILEQILGCKIVDEFDRYDDMRAVAANHARTEHTKHKKDGEEVLPDQPAEKKEDKKISDEPTEVVK